MKSGKIQQWKQKMKRIKFIYIPYIRIRNYGINKSKTKNLHKNGYAVLDKITEIMRDSGLQSFCAFGTLLGLYRDGGFISTDNDIDMGVMGNEEFSWEMLEQRMTEGGFKKIRQFQFEGIITEQTYIFHKVTADFFLFQEENEKMAANIYFRKEGKSYSCDEEYSVMQRQFAKIAGITAMPVHGIQVLVPTNCEEVIASIYGEGWKTPDPRYRHKDHCVYLEDRYAYGTFWKA